MTLIGRLITITALQYVIPDHPPLSIHRHMTAVENVLSKIFVSFTLITIDE